MKDCNHCKMANVYNFVGSTWVSSRLLTAAEETFLKVLVDCHQPEVVVVVVVAAAAALIFA